MTRLAWSATALATFALGCSNSSSSNGPVVYGDAAAGTPETPPTTSGADVEAWLRAGYYKQWQCESAPHAPRGTSPHANFDRVCSNDVVSAAAAATGPWPEGAASVKELWNATTDPAPAGYAVSVKTQADSANGASWFWYERLASNTVLADGLDQSSCVPCHGSAGSNDADTTSTGSRDYVYTPVP